VQPCLVIPKQPIEGFILSLVKGFKVLPVQPLYLQRSEQRLAACVVPGFAPAQRARRKVEALFGELKNQIGLGRLRLRRLRFVREQFYLAAAVQNLKRLVRFLSFGPRTATAGI